MKMKILSHIALFLALTLSARAQGQSFLGPVKDGPTYLYDDGTSEYVWSNTGNQQLPPALWFNQFTAVPGAQTILSVDIAWGRPNNSTPAKRLNGLPVTIGIWSDPNGDANPSDAELLSLVSGTVEHANTDTFVTYTFPTPVTLFGDSFFIGYLSPGSEPFVEGRPHGHVLFASEDTSSPVGKSWIATMNGPALDFVHIGRNKHVETTEELGLPGNWMIRANADGPTY